MSGAGHEKLSENDARVKFDYDVLMRDLGVIRSGINRRLAQLMNSVTPSLVDELGGDYMVNTNELGISIKFQPASVLYAPLL
ncbi:MAG: hypothetical protein CMI01_14230 [Oceanospirillaceae bacterium]|nr:hypothetical protein [Oceanospirillaceae bacterium]